MKKLVLVLAGLFVGSAYPLVINIKNDSKSRISNLSVTFRFEGKNKFHHHHNELFGVVRNISIPAGETVSVDSKDAMHEDTPVMKHFKNLPAPVVTVDKFHGQTLGVFKRVKTRMHGSEATNFAIERRGMGRRYTVVEVE